MTIAWSFIACCWIAWLAYWVVMAFKAKRTVERGSFLAYRVVGLGVFVVIAAAGHLLHVSAQDRLWTYTTAVGVAAGASVAAGAAFAVWARVALGRNWSAEVTFKEDHELVQSGPYAFVRHPIYTGLLLMALGTATNYGRAIGFALLVTVCAAVWWKAHLEERIMDAHFPAAYADYRTRVRSIIPFVL
ncbi:MAG TPA: isoprenylcysteine carboxylmethyltransferase family protein [Solirubrobacteraceae bacterium]|jgi:protein-S-isoprenylcysteine O-methyltransferase Ste14|nr:isoprenylcysteine carboxylmethyltransferase family protein [Solirubrobacteraceae bacterium]